MERFSETLLFGFGLPAILILGAANRFDSGFDEWDVPPLVCDWLYEGHFVAEIVTIEGKVVHVNMSTGAVEVG